MQFRKKPVTIDAIQWTGDNASEVLRFMFPDIEVEAEATITTIKTLEGDMRVSKGDWIIRGVKGELHPCKPDIFAATYEPANQPTALDFLKRCSTECGRIISSGDLTHHQIVDRQAHKAFFVEPGGGFGWALLPWDLTTDKDRARESDYFSRNDMMA